MLKILFWGLLLANVALFAFDRGLLGAFASDGREPARLLNQLNADKIKPVPASPAPAPPSPVDAAAPATSPVALVDATLSQSATALVACTEIGPFEAADAKRFETQLIKAAKDISLTKRSIKDVARHMVYIPSQGDKEGADRKSGELKQLGITDFYVIQTDPELKWGLSLGIFKTEDAARSHLATLTAKGVRSARLGLHSVSSNRVAFQLRDIDPATKTILDRIKADFPRQELRACSAA